MFWLASFILSHAETVTITWGTWGSYTLESTNLLLVLLLTFIAFYCLIWLIKSLLGMKKNIQNYRRTHLSHKAGQNFTQGLIQFTSGYWQKSEVLLLQHINYAETPLLHYLAAARAAHMQENYDQRDQYLKKAVAKDDNARIAIAVSQAEMQLESKQVEQARATLVHLLELFPAHPYATRLLASVYYKQEDWNHLFALLPALKKQKQLRVSVQKKYAAAALKGIFQSAAFSHQPKKLQRLWEELSPEIQSTPQAVLHYIDALIFIDDTKLAEKILLDALNKNWDADLVERFGQIEHVSLNKSIQQAEKWLQHHDNSPELLVCLARLYRSNMLWRKACHFYEAALNMSPDSKGYLEFAELLAHLDDDDNAALCYQKGLRYCATKKGETLYLKSTNLADSSKTEKIEKDVEIFYTT